MKLRPSWWQVQVSRAQRKTLWLTRAMVDAGRRLSWPPGMMVDKHCVGGVPGNRTSMIVVRSSQRTACAAPKTSSRAITSPSGLRIQWRYSLASTLTEDHLRSVVTSHNAALAWGGRMELSPADDALISVERPLRLDAPEQMVASILSKDRCWVHSLW